jgi:ABC-2 type transport system permease protein
MTGSLLAVYTLCLREVVRFVRQRSRVVGALGQPVIFWLLLGGGLKGSFRPAGEGAGTDYLQYFYPGIIALTLLFTAIFATISVVEDRKGGFLQGVLVAPVPRWSIVAGQAAGSTVLAVIQGALLLLLAPVAGLHLTLEGAVASIGVMVLLGFTLSGLGLLLAWKMDSTQGFHAIMNLLLLPMWLLSGAFFPAEGAPWWLAWPMKINPMTYGMAALRRSLYLGGNGVTSTAVGQVATLSPLWSSLGIIALFGALTFIMASSLARRAAP